jgi:hypothetical protein
MCGSLPACLIEKDAEILAERNDRWELGRA